MKRNKSLILKIFLYLSIFSFLILFFIWLLQILLLNKYYEYYKTEELSNTLNLIKNNYNSDTFYNTLENVAYNTDFCIEITSDNETIYSYIKHHYPKSTDRIEFFIGCHPSGMGQGEKPVCAPKQ